MLIAAVPVDPSREQARSWALEELGKREYTSRAPGLVERFLNWAYERLTGIDLPGGSGNALVMGVVLVVIVLLVGIALRFAGGLRREAKGEAEAPLLGAAVLTADEHRALAAGHAGAGRWKDAVVERFRALARQLEQDGVLLPAPGRTAGELARETGRRAPELGAAVTRAAAVFDDARYGEREAGPEQLAEVAEVDDQVRGKTPAGRR